MEQERHKRAMSRENRRGGKDIDLTFGPKETHETLMFTQLKKQQDMDQTRDELTG